MNEFKPGWDQLLNQQRIFIDPLYNWAFSQKDDNKCHVKGWFRHNDKVFKEQEAARKIISFLAKKMQPKDISGAVKELQGNFVFILETPAQIIASVDKIRSYPIFYTGGERAFYISNSAQLLQKERELYDKDLDSFLEFQMAGYVTGKETLFKNLNQLQAGECLFYDNQYNEVTVRRYYKYYPLQINNSPEQELLEELHDSTVKTFSNMLDTLNGRKVWIPLSGGLDSRLILGVLTDLKYDNVATFTYGIPQLWEVKWAKLIAEHADVEWHYIQYFPRSTKEIFHTQERKNYFRFASGLCSTPSISDHYALIELRKQNLIDEQSIIINGQSGDFLTGGHIPNLFETFEKGYIPIDCMMQYCIDKHFSLWLNLVTDSNCDAIKDKILRFMNYSEYTFIAKDEATYLYELWEWQERQCKYVINGQRMYEWFGYDWRLPLWSDELMLFWQNTPWQFKISQKLYKRYLHSYNPGHLFNQVMPEIHYYEPNLFKPMNKLYVFIAKMLNLAPGFFLRKYMKYYSVYSPYYPQKSYFQYLKDSCYHRNHVSYISRELLLDLHFMN